MDERDRTIQLAELSRHLDTLLWTVTSIWATAIGGLLLFCYQDPKKFPALIFLGFILVPCAFYFASNFRRLRNAVHDKMPPGLERIYVSREPIRQWNVFAFIFLSLATVWTYLAFAHEVWQCEITAAVVTAEYILLLLIWWYGKPRKCAEQKCACSGHTTVKPSSIPPALKCGKQTHNGGLAIACALVCLTCIVAALSSKRA